METGVGAGGFLGMALQLPYAIDAGNLQVGEPLNSHESAQDVSQ